MPVRPADLAARSAHDLHGQQRANVSAKQGNPERRVVPPAFLKQTRQVRTRAPQARPLSIGAEIVARCCGQDRRASVTSMTVLFLDFPRRGTSAKLAIKQPLMPCHGPSRPGSCRGSQSRDPRLERKTS